MALGMDDSAVWQKGTRKKRAGKHLPLPQNFHFSPCGKGNQVCGHIFRLESLSITAFLIRVSLRTMSSEMCFWNEVIITYSPYL